GHASSPGGMGCPLGGPRRRAQLPPYNKPPWIVAAAAEKHHPDAPRGIGIGVGASEPTAVGMADEYERWFHAGLVEQRVQLIDDLPKRTRVGAEFAPAVACAVVRANARELGDTRLDEPPFHRKVTQAGFDDDRRL